MRRSIRSVIFLFAVIWPAIMILCGCSDVTPDDPLYVYGMGLDADAIGVQLYVLAGKDSNKKDDSSGGAGSAGDSGSSSSDQGSAGQGKQKNSGIMTFGGASVEETFKAFFDANKDVYTGTNKVYVVGEGMTDEQLWDFKVHLANSNKLPVKKEIIRNESPYVYLEENAGMLTE